MKLRKEYLSLNEKFTLHKAGLTVWAYSKQDNFLGRVEVNHAGIAVYVGARGKKRLGNLSWEKFFDRMKPKRKK